MKADLSNEQRFIADVDAFQFIAQDVEAILHALEDWLAQLNADLQANALTHAGLSEHGALARQSEAIHSALKKGALSWSRQRAALGQAQALAESFDDKALLLVFGKFNAGKSSFCNFLADRFAAHGKSVHYFHVDGGCIVETSVRFKEGVTETTARLQGVRLGENLVLVDTPGLHSMTPENAALTQRFTDSADAVLWLTSSTSPGQVQELDELSRELHRNKPLLPVVTRSDRYEEDEADGEIVKMLCNKGADNRAQQEADVRIRAEDKLASMGVETALLKAPVSISAYMAREQGQTPEALTDAGFERLYGALMAIAEPALDYKRRKSAEILLHHLEENVLGLLHREVFPLLTALDASSRAALDSLGMQQERIAAGVWRSVAPTLAALLERYAPDRDVQSICLALSQSILDAFSREVRTQFAGHVIEAEALDAYIELDSAVGFEEIVIGGEVVGVDYQRLHGAFAQAIRQSVLRLCVDAAGRCEASIRQSMERAARLSHALLAREQALLDLKRRIRS